jgi:Cft2 family RNA processing exonuclease
LLLAELDLFIPNLVAASTRQKVSEGNFVIITSPGMRQDGVSRNIFSEVFGKSEFARAFYFYKTHDLCEDEIPSR